MPYMGGNREKASVSSVSFPIGAGKGTDFQKPRPTCMGGKKKKVSAAFSRNGGKKERVSDIINNLQGR